MTGRKRMVLSASYNARARLAARGETPAAFGRRCIPAPPHGAQSAPWGPRADCVAPASNIPAFYGKLAAMTRSIRTCLCLALLLLARSVSAAQSRATTGDLTGVAVDQSKA